VSPEEIKALRRELGASIKDFSQALGIEQTKLLAWETGSEFPTKRMVVAMQALSTTPKAGTPATGSRQAPLATEHADALGRLADPALWELLRKLMSYPELFQSCRKLAESFEDPTGAKK
jgi:transcriptional regulator with XRE-family HTH domain